jgi:hypothetical protein
MSCGARGSRRRRCSARGRRSGSRRWDPARSRAPLGAPIGWEASYLSPAGFTARWQRLSTLLRAEGRAVDTFPRSVELDAIVSPAGDALDSSIDRFCAARSIPRAHPLLDTVLAGDGPAIARQMADYESAGATDLMLGFADFPSTGMLQTFAATVLHDPTRVAS